MNAALMLIAMQGPVSAPIAGEDIVVVARRLEQAAAIVGRDPRGRLTCSLTQSTGNLRLDAALCRTASKCLKTVGAEQPAISACIDRRKPALLAQIRRAGGSQ